MKHVFIGHGDSDKIASVNPFSKVYDEVWTAGRAGRDRYAHRRRRRPGRGHRRGRAARSWRPIDAGRAPPEGPVPTVLYAPTWEGWDDDPGNTSLLLAGENIVRKLLDGRPAGPRPLQAAPLHRHPQRQGGRPRTRGSPR